MAIAGLNPTELVELAVLLLLVGALAGFLAGVFGIGGGAVLVPVFYECFRLAGVPLEVPSIMTQRICGTGFELFRQAGEQIEAGACEAARRTRWDSAGKQMFQESCG